MKLISIIAGAALLAGCAGVGDSCNPSKSYASKGLSCQETWPGSGRSYLTEMPSYGQMCSSQDEIGLPYKKDGKMLVCKVYDDYGIIAVKADGDPTMDKTIAEVLKARKEQQALEEKAEEERRKELITCVTGLNITLGASSRLMAYGLGKPETDLKAIYYNEISQNGALMGVNYKTYEESVKSVTRDIKKACKNDRDCVGFAGYKFYKDTEKYYSDGGYDFDAYCSKQSK